MKKFTNNSTQNRHVTNVTYYMRGNITKRFFHFLILSVFLTSCAAAVTPTETAANTPTPVPPTATSTITPVPTITPTITPVEKPITDLTAWEKSEGERIAKEAGFANYREYVQKKLVENPEYDTKGMWGGSIVEPYVYGSAEGIVMEQATVPILSDYWKGNGVEKAEVLLMAFEHTLQPISVLAGFHMSDGTYISMLPLEVGADAENLSGDRLLKKPEDLKQLVGKLRSIKMVDRLNEGPDYNFDDYSKNWDKLKSMKDIGNVKQKYNDIIGIRPYPMMDFFEYALYNPGGYIRANTSREMFFNPPVELQEVIGETIVTDAEHMLPLQLYNLTHGGGGADSWMVAMVIGQNDGVFKR